MIGVDEGPVATRRDSACAPVNMSSPQNPDLQEKGVLDVGELLDVSECEKKVTNSDAGVEKSETDNNVNCSRSAENDKENITTENADDPNGGSETISDVTHQPTSEKYTPGLTPPSGENVVTKTAESDKEESSMNKTHTVSETTDDDPTDSRNKTLDEAKDDSRKLESEEETSAMDVDEEKVKGIEESLADGCDGADKCSLSDTMKISSENTSVVSERIEPDDETSDDTAVIPTENAPEKENSTVTPTIPEIDLTKEDEVVVTTITEEDQKTTETLKDENLNTTVSVQSAPANKELMSAMAATTKRKEKSDAVGSENQEAESVFDKLITAALEEDSKYSGQMKAKTAIADANTGSKEKPRDQQPSTSDAPLKNLASKFTCIGSAQRVVSRPIAPKPSTSTTDSTPKQSHVKRTEKFIIKNASKVSRVYKVSNLSYKIKPVRKNLTNSPCPVIYVGEPAFTDLDDLFAIGGKGTENLIIPSEIKDEDLYDISKLQSAFAPTDSASSSASKPSFARAYPYSDIPHPSLNMRPSFSPLPPALNQMFLPQPARIPYRGVPNFHQGGMIRIVARTVPSATMAGHVATTTGAKIRNPITTVKGGYHQPIKVVPATSVVGIQPTSYKTPTPSAPTSSVAQQRFPVPAPKVSSSQPKKTIAPKMDVMTVKIFPGNNAASRKTELGGFGNPVKFITQGVSPKVTNSSGVIVANDKKTAGLVFTPKIETKTPAKPLSSKSPSVASKNSFSQTLAKIATSVQSQDTVISPIANIKSEIGKPGFVKTQAKSDSPSRPLREGVEVMFEDGVRHFITNLRHMTHHDDEPIKAWSDLKKGAQVAAKWVDGQIYDATVVGCYFSVEKKLQPVVKLEKLPEKAQTSSPKRKKHKARDSETKIGCTECRVIFKTLFNFRKHQKAKCKSPGILVPSSASKVTDAMMQAVRKDDTSESKKPNDRNAGKKAKKSRKRAIAEAETTEKPPQKKQKTKETGKPVSQSAVDKVDSVFKQGTKFIHRWQLDDGTIRWYQGEVKRVISTDKAFLDCEFEVAYKGENESYTLKLYEDYPADIRILGKT